MVQNKGLIFKSVPTDWPVEGKDLTIEDRGFDLDAEPDKNGITIKTYYVSFDPYEHFGPYTSSLSMKLSRTTWEQEGLAFPDAYLATSFTTSNEQC